MRFRSVHHEAFPCTNQAPRRYHVVHEIPKNHVGKPLKRILREMPEPG